MQSQSSSSSLDLRLDSAVRGRRIEGAEDSPRQTEKGKTGFSSVRFKRPV